jgi:hypothetical protein
LVVKHDLSAEFGYANSNNVKYKYLDFFFLKGEELEFKFSVFAFAKSGKCFWKKNWKRGKNFPEKSYKAVKKKHRRKLYIIIFRTKMIN